jgi:hypothetical protein
VAAAEMSAAIFFYCNGAFSVSFGVSVVVGIFVAFSFHWLTHSILSDTALGFAFGKRHENGAMKLEVITNVVLSIILLSFAACTVFFLGKKGFSAWRATNYEAKNTPLSNEPKDGVKQLQLSPEMLTNGKGKISAYKLEQLAAVTDAQAKRQKAEAEATNAKSEAEATKRKSYDRTTANISDVVGASAFVLELLLLLLSFSVATAKKAATIERLAIASKAESEETHEKKQPQNEIQSNVSVFPSHPFSENSTAKRPKIGFRYAQTTPTASVNTAAVEQTTPTASVNTAAVEQKLSLRLCENCNTEFVYKIHNQRFCCEICRIEAWEKKTGKKFRKKEKI